MLFDWNTYQAELTKSIPEFAKLSPDSLKGYQTLSAANSNNSLLGEKVRQPISLAVADNDLMRWLHHVPHGCCAEGRHEQAGNCGSAGGAMAINAGAALIYSLRALDSADGHSAKT
jgi:hypothetical protein